MLALRLALFIATSPHPSLYWGVVTAPGLSVDGGGGVIQNENFPAIASKLNLGLVRATLPSKPQTERGKRLINHTLSQWES
ncbi:hypothetical protein BS47DRAFT_475549 [Hydnum rufescens UP504]|uniref:Uncharacterized protein n=1 Tax=Hydnum rufescens UP504 TaxID=1448309 RepID=A0A9P6E061_9AGAM|nr:hypothetical protein BS47DRAFT_475549 [Hydnum rufescens UP504]